MFRSAHAGRRILCLIGLLLVLALGFFLLRDRLFPPTPEALVTLAENNPEAADFVSRYRQLRRRDYSAEAVDLSADMDSGGVPHLIQWDDRWGCAPYGESILAVSGCGPTSLSMVALALTGDVAVNPIAVGEYSASQGWYYPGTGTSWELMRSGAEHFGLEWEELSLSEEIMRQTLSEDRLIILSMLPGDFTTSGHFIVVRGCSEAGFSVLDPNSRERSHDWSFERLSGQIANIWAYTAK